MLGDGENQGINIVVFSSANTVVFRGRRSMLKAAYNNRYLGSDQLRYTKITFRCPANLLYRTLLISLKSLFYGYFSISLN